MYVIVTLFVVSALLDSLNQMRITPIDFPKESKKYRVVGRLPWGIYEWELLRWGNKVILDAFHQYQGWGLFLYGLTLVQCEQELLWLQFTVWSDIHIHPFLFYGGVTALWYQLRDLFMHVILGKR